MTISVTFLDFVVRGWSCNVFICISAHYKCRWWWWW